MNVPSERFQKIRFSPSGVAGEQRIAATARQKCYKCLLCFKKEKIGLRRIASEDFSPAFQGRDVKIVKGSASRQ
jgi:hypothetical protein